MPCWLCENMRYSGYTPYSHLSKFCVHNHVVMSSFDHAISISSLSLHFRCILFCICLRKKFITQSCHAMLHFFSLGECFLSMTISTSVATSLHPCYHKIFLYREFGAFLWCSPHGSTLLSNLLTEKMSVKIWEVKNMRSKRLHLWYRWSCAEFTAQINSSVLRGWHWNLCCL